MKVIYLSFSYDIYFSFSIPQTTSEENVECQMSSNAPGKVICYNCTFFSNVNTL